MVRTSAVKFPDVENNSRSHCNIAEASVSRCQMWVAIHRNWALFAAEFCVSVIYVPRETWTKISG